MFRVIKAALMVLGGVTALMLLVTIVLGLGGKLDDQKRAPANVATKIESGPFISEQAAASPTPNGNAPAAPAAMGFTARYLVAPKLGMVVVWRDHDAMVRGLKIAFAGNGMGSLPLERPLIACGVHSGTKIIVDVEAEEWSSVLVLDGAATGCQGAVPNVFISGKL